MKMEFFMKNMISVMVVIAAGTLAKSYRDTDLTSDFTSAVDDQYPWSALPPSRGPTVQETLEWKWTPADRSEEGPVDKFLQPPWKKPWLAPAKHNARSMPSSKKIEDKGPGSMEVYRLTSPDDSELNLISRWSNLELRKKIMKNKLPRKLSDNENPHKIEMKQNSLPINEKQMISNIIKTDELNDSQGVPELQIGCEGLEASMELSSREQRSIKMENNTTREDDSYVDSLVPPALHANPVTIDWNYDDNEHKNYNEMDELLKLKKLETQKKKKYRGDMISDDDDDDDGRYDFKKAPVRGDLVGGRKVRSILERPERATGRNNHGPWGFGENDGYITDNDNDYNDDDDDSDNSAQRIEADRTRQEYERMRAAEMERRRKEMNEREQERRRQEAMRRNDNELSQIERIRKEYEARQSSEQRAQERKLKEYIERNRPIIIESPDERNRRIEEGVERRTGINSDGNGPVRGDHSRGPSPPASYPSSSRAEARRRQEVELRRMEEESRRADARRLEEESVRLRQNQTNDYSIRRSEDMRRRQEAYLRQREQERMRAEQSQTSENPNRRYEEELRKEMRRIDEEERRRSEENKRRREEEERREEEYRRMQSRLYEDDRNHQLMEQKKKEPGVISVDQAGNRGWEERRLNALPVSARIILTRNSSSPRSGNTSPSLSSRGNFNNDGDLPAINPNRPGLTASRFPAAPTPRPPSNSPSSCVWAIVQCCPNTDQRRLSNCFEYMGCPGVNWDPSPCRDSIASAAKAEVVRYYASGDQL